MISPFFFKFDLRVGKNIVSFSLLGNDFDDDLYTIYTISILL